LRNAAVVGDWSWLNKVRISGPDATAFLDRISVKDVTYPRFAVDASVQACRWTGSRSPAS
jgi:glycine cleavage system aminomethyltransferase T